MKRGVICGLSVLFFLSCWVFALKAEAQVVFQDDFSQDTRSQYTIKQTWTEGGTGRLVYDATGKRLQARTGDNISMAVGHTVTPLEAGVFKIDFLPTAKFPSGGWVTLRLLKDTKNYYEVNNTDGYGPGYIAKVVDGRIVASAPFHLGYAQNVKQAIHVTFGAAEFTVAAFGETLSAGSESTLLVVSRFEIELGQQHAYLDNIEVSDSASHAPIANAGQDVSVREGQPVTLDGSKSTDPDGAIMAYQWAQVGTGTPVVLTGANGPQPTFTAPNVGIAGETFAFRLTVTDDDGLTSSDDVAVEVLPSQSAWFSDDFSADSRSQYTVTNTWTSGGTGRVLYDATGKRLLVKTGDDISISLAHSVPPLLAGIYKVTFLPTVKYPSGGWFILRLLKDAGNYYEINNTDGYGPGTVSKVVNGQTVATTTFQSGYVQNKLCSLSLVFAPTAVLVEAFGEQLTLETSPANIVVNRFEIELGQQQCYIDNVIYSGETFIRILRPEDHHIQPKEDPNIQVKALAENLDPGWGVQFVLDRDTARQRVIKDMVFPYEATFSNAARTEHTVDAFVIDAAGTRLLGAETHDEKVQVGVGDCYAAVGDSITEGLGDNDPSDDLSRDGRNSGGGYGPPLNDLLTSVEAYPHSVTNREGVSGARSADGLAVIAKALAAHPGARVFLIQYGTNDSHGTLPVPSGLGKNPGDPGYAGSFKDNMHRIVTIVLAAGKVPALAKVPITLGPCSACTPFKDPTVASRNLLIQQYNAAIDELVAHFALTVVPPDFYRYFNEHRDQFSDRLHPNGAGYRAMADLWQSSLSDR